MGRFLLSRLLSVGWVSASVTHPTPHWGGLIENRHFVEKIAGSPAPTNHRHSGGLWRRWGGFIDIAMDSSVMERASHLLVGIGTGETPVLRPNFDC
jgi:hypothetical protein